MLLALNSWFDRLFNTVKFTPDLVTKLDEVDELIDQVKDYNQEITKLNKELQEMYYFLDNIITAAGGYLWAKDIEGRYIYCDRSFCEEFFGIKPAGMVCPTNKRKDSELIQEFIRRTGKNHSFGKVCIASLLYFP